MDEKVRGEIKMVKLVVDTDIIIDYLRAGKGPFLEILDLQQKGSAEIYVSTISVLELYAGQSSKTDAAQVEKILDNLAIVELSRELAKFAGEKKRDLSASSTINDLIIGCTALVLKARLVTRNRKHFEQIPGLKFF